MTAAGLLGALKNDAAEQQSSTWDSYQHWPYNGEHSCVAHHVRFLSEGYDDQPNLVVESWFSNDIGVASVQNRMDVNYPRTDDIAGGNAETNATATAIGRGRPAVGNRVDVPNGRSMEVENVRSDRRKSTDMKVQTPDEEEFKKQYPAIYEEKGTPSRTVEFPSRAETIVTTGQYVD
ncbi:hypothetical protein [Natrinema altunense]|uniref:hypothetical protein n=1 Tax=Natrinema altunense TaxID=222984 RepID=UPI0011860CF3|nr:hypothetical protein [Natrinema altunense]